MGILTSMFTAVTGLSSYGNAKVSSAITSPTWARRDSSPAGPPFFRFDFFQHGRRRGKRSDRPRRVPQRCCRRIFPGAP